MVSGLSACGPSQFSGYRTETKRWGEKGNIVRTLVCPGRKRSQIDRVTFEKCSQKHHILCDLDWIYWCPAGLQSNDWSWFSWRPSSVCWKLCLQFENENTFDDRSFFVCPLYGHMWNVAVTNNHLTWLSDHFVIQAGQRSELCPACIPE